MKVENEEEEFSSDFSATPCICQHVPSSWRLERVFEGQKAAQTEQPRALW